MMNGGAAAAMSQFFIRDDDEDGIRRCKLSQIDGALITIAGLTADGQVELFTGVVQSLVHDGKRDPDRRWRVTLYGGETQTSTRWSA
jgi:hypothetical protein